MGLKRRRGRGFIPWLLGSPLLSCLVLSLLSPRAHTDGGADGTAVAFVAAPPRLSSSPSATFRFEVMGNEDFCPSCTVSCKLDNYSSSNCKSKEISYVGLYDGSHTFEVCISGHRGVRCTSYNWTVDTVPPTAYVSAETSFTDKSNVSVRITFSEPCPGEGGFRCSFDECSLLVYGSGHVIPSSLKTLQRDVDFSLLVGISADVQYGRLVLVTEKGFCTDAAGNRFTRSSNSSFFLHFDRRNVFVSFSTRIPEKHLQLNGAIRTVTATNSYRDLEIYLHFSEPVLNSSTEILGVLHASSGLLVPTNRSSLGNRRFGYTVNNIPSMAIVTITCETSSIISRQGSPVSPSDQVTFLYDTQRHSVMLSTTSRMRTREQNISVLIKFVKPVFAFNSSSILIYGGHLLSFHEVSMSIYMMQLHLDDRTVSVEIPENAAADIAGNKNLASSRLQVRHYSMPLISTLVSTISTVVFLATSLVSALLSMATASLVASGAFSESTSYLVSEPSRNLMRIACHIQIFALSRWLAVTLPIEYFEFLRGIEWSIPYRSLPWETEESIAIMEDLYSPVQTYSEVSERSKLMSLTTESSNEQLKMNASAYGTSLTPMEYRSFLENQDLKPEAQFIVDSRVSNRWTSFGRNTFWLTVIGGGLMVLHGATLFILKLRKNNSEKQRNFGALEFPRFEIFLLFLALPCICQASATIIKGGSTAGILVGVVLLGFSSFLLLSLLLFLSFGITMGKLLQYKEVHQEGEEFHWYQEIIRVCLGPGKKGQWTWRDQPNSIYLTKLGPLFEDLRGPPKYMLSQIAGHSSNEKRSDKIIASDDETEDAEAPFIQKVFGILRIYYTLLESLKRVSLGIVAGAYSSSRFSRVPTLVVLSITSFQLLFLALKKPFIKKKVQLVEMIVVASEIGIFVTCLVLSENNFSDAGEQRVGFFMLGLFIVGFTAQMINEWYALYKQVVRLSVPEDSFSSGLKMVLLGFLLVVLPENLSTSLNKWFASNRGDCDTGHSVASSEQVQRSSTTRDKPWMRQLRELAKASFSKEDGGSPNDPSSSRNPRSGFWGGKRSGSSSMTSSADFKAKGDFKARSKQLYKDMEAIFSSN